MSTLITVPSSSCFASVSMSLKRVVATTESPFTLEEQAFKWPGEQWAISFNMPPFVSRSLAADWISFALKLEGAFNRFLMGDPSARLPRGVATGTPLVNGGNQVGNTLVTDGWTNSVTGILLKGDYFQLGTGINARLHMLTEDANSDGSGNSVLTFVPALRLSPTDNSAIVINNARGVFRLVDNTYSWDVQPGPLYRLSFQAVEVVNA